MTNINNLTVAEINKRHEEAEQLKAYAGYYMLSNIKVNDGLDYQVEIDEQLAEFYPIAKAYLHSDLLYNQRIKFDVNKLNKADMTLYHNSGLVLTEYANAAYADLNDSICDLTYDDGSRKSNIIIDVNVIHQSMAIVYLTEEDCATCCYLLDRGELDHKLTEFLLNSMPTEFFIRR